MGELDTGTFTFAPEPFRCEGEGSGIGRESWDGTGRLQIVPGREQATARTLVASGPSLLLEPGGGQQVRLSVK